jgi:hypothetical protein
MQSKHIPFQFARPWTCELAQVLQTCTWQMLFNEQRSKIDPPPGAHELCRKTAQKPYKIHGFGIDTCNKTTCNTIERDRACRLQLVRLPSKPLDHRSSRKIEMARLRLSEDPPLATAPVGQPRATCCSFLEDAMGPVARWIRHRPTEPGGAGSSPAGVNDFVNTSTVQCQSCEFLGEGSGRLVMATKMLQRHSSIHEQGHWAEGLQAAERAQSVCRDMP